MKRDEMVIGAVVLALAAGGLLALWLQRDEPAPRPVVEALGGPQPAWQPPARAAQR